MTDEEKARALASKYARRSRSNELSKEAVRQGAMEMAEWKEKQLINNACIWLSFNADVFGFFKKTKLQNMVNEFAKAMKGGKE